jgi:aspartyl-tRNA(Asn)/glutamyl-tRNA(Gln) amidotransferase subunit A
MSDPALLTLTEAAEAIRARKISSVELTQALLARIPSWQPRINAFVSIESEDALAAARRADENLALARGLAAGPLHGVPLAHKDMYYFAGKPANCGSKIRAGWIPSSTSTVISRLQDAGAFRFGALHMAEFAYGPTGHNAHLGPARNPWNPAHITGGSVRGPAHFCGVTGLKTSAGRVSRANVMPLSFTLDTVGPLARTAEDCGLLMSVICGPDPLDPTTAAAPPWDADEAERSVEDLTVGVPDAFYADDLDADVARALDDSIRVLRACGAKIVPVTLPDQTLVSAAALIVIASEAAAYHAPWLRTRAGDYGPQTRARLENGLGYSAIQYLEALRWRGPALAAQLAALGEVDAVVAPTARAAAPTIAETDVGGGPGADAIIQNITRLMRPMNYLGLPALTLPSGFSRAGLPIGMQLIGRPFRDETLIALGRAFQQQTDFHTKMPTLA